MDEQITLTKAEAAAAFDRWETHFRANPEEFMTAEETAAMETAPLAERCAITFFAYLREVRG